MNRKNFFKTLSVVPFVKFPAGSFGKESSSEACQTQRDAEGPYYKPDSPSRALIETNGVALKIEGGVFSASDCKTPIANAVLDVWHCDDSGKYDLKGFKCRGQVMTDARGKYQFTTIYPPAYSGRPRHIHFKVRASGFKELTTQLYFSGDPNIQNDFARNATKERVITLTSEKNISKGSFNIYL